VEARTLDVQPQALRDHLVGVARRFLRHREDAEDVAQETLLRVLAARAEGVVIRDEYAFGTSAAVRLSIDRLRSNVNGRAGRERRAERSPPAIDSTAMPADVTGLYEAIAALPPKQAAVITLRKLRQMEYADIADVLDISQESCRSHCRLGLLRLRKILGASG